MKMNNIDSFARYKIQTHLKRDHFLRKILRNKQNKIVIYQRKSKRNNFGSHKKLFLSCKIFSKDYKKKCQKNCKKNYYLS